MKFFSKIAFPALLGLSLVACSKQAPSSYSDGIIRVRVDSEGTKSSIISSENIKTSPGKFIMEAYVDRDVFNDPEGLHAHTRVGNPYFGPTSKLEENVVYDSGNSCWNLSYWNPSDAEAKPCHWVSSEGNMSFWSRVKSQNGLNDITIDTENSALYLTSENIDEEKGVKMVFDYSLPTPTLESNPSATSFADASNQEDLVFSYWEDVLHPATTDPETGEPTSYPEYQDVWVHFYHALSQIRFAFSNDDSSFENALQIKSIAISEVASGGTCTFWGTLAMNEFVNKDPYAASDVTRDLASLFTWSAPKAAKTYRQDYGVTINSGTSEYAGWTKGSYTKDTHTYNLYTCQNVFMMIPQTLSSSACIRLTVFDDSKPEGQKEQEFVSYLRPLGTSWEPGKYYTYKINYLNNQITFKLTLGPWDTVGDPKTYTID